MFRLRRLGLYSTTWGIAANRDRRIFLLVMLLHFAGMVWYNGWQSPACDESSYFSYAIRWAKGHPERTGILDDSKTPVVIPALWSLTLRDVFPGMENNHGEALLSAGRMAMYGYFFMISLGFFCWGYRLFGTRKWVLPWLFLITDPLLISNALLIGSDMAAACCLFWAGYLAWRFSVTRSMRYWWLFALVSGFALVVKLSMVILIPICALLLWVNSTGKTAGPTPEPLLKTGLRWLGLAIICLLLINVAYQFSETCLPFKNFQPQSASLQRLQQEYPTLSSIPIPVPQPYLGSYDLLLRNAETGGGHTDSNSYHGIFLNGRYKASGQFRDYYGWQFLFKTTPLLLLALSGGLLVWILKKGNRYSRLKKWSFVWIPPLGFLLWLIMANPFQIGIRHAIPAWPFLYLLSGTFMVWSAQQFPKIWVVVLALQWAEIAWHLPNLNAYTPVWMQPKETLYRRIFDSSLTYCNDARLYRHFLRKHPEYRVPTTLPEAGRYALRLDECNSYTPANGPLSCWLLKYFTPVGHYKSTILLFHISEQEIITLKQQGTVLKQTHQK